jgi:hypothetical protein
MEKLIELLNEYEEELNTGLHWRTDEKYWMLWRWLNLMWVDQYLISKHYWFIKRLVDNDKIDLEEYKNESGLYTLKVIYWTDHYIDLLTNKVNSDFLLMLLSIQDNPIEFLDSILK